MLLSHHLAEKGGFTCVVSRSSGKLLGPVYIWQHEMTSNFQLTHMMHKYLLILQRTDTMIIIFTCILRRYHKTLKWWLFTGHQISSNRDMYRWEQERRFATYHLCTHPKISSHSWANMQHIPLPRRQCVICFKLRAMMCNVNYAQKHCYHEF